MTVPLTDIQNTQQYQYSLKDIASWQLDSDNSDVELPALQRNFVWKVNQIESLWDSILRGFPIGSFLLSKSEDEKLFLLDGQQRATSIAIGYYNPWMMSGKDKNNFWSLKNIPIIWIDFAPKEKTTTQKFVLRVVTQSHPWGYQRINHTSILSASDRRNALNNFRQNPLNKQKGYVHLSQLSIFPYDSDLPVPLSFVIKSISENGSNWKEILISMCETNLPVSYIKTKHSNSNYIDQLKVLLYSPDFDKNIFNSFTGIDEIRVPAIIVKREILKAEDEQTGEDPTLFVRLNSSGTKIAGEELIYSIYKASFPEAKKLVENIGANFVAPSLVISLISRLAISELNSVAYPYPISVTDFRKRIQDDTFKRKLTELIGDKKNSPAANIFITAFEILLSESEFEIPPVLVKNIVKNSPELFLLLLQWIKLNDALSFSSDTKRKVLGAITALSWFGRDNNKYVREVWKSTHLENFWNKEILSIPFANKHDFIMYPLIKPATLKVYLIKAVVDENTPWDNLYPKADSNIAAQYKNLLNSELVEEGEINRTTNSIWDSFINKLFSNKAIVLFAQRKFINDNFGDFNQMETLEDTNTPWDWDHIYPYSWVGGKWYIHPNTRHWTNSAGNFRAMSLEENRSENNSYSPSKRLVNARTESFIKESDWEYWSKINGRINDGDTEMIKNHLSAVVTRLCNLYEEWYSTLKIDELFNFETHKK